MSDVTDVAIVGAGPYGLSLAAHLKGAGVSFRQFGTPMDLWRSHMPAGMFLKSQGFASNLSDPAGTHTLEAFCRQSGREYARYGLPVSLDTFVSYGQWFRSERVPELEEVLVKDVAQQGGEFLVTLADGNQARARSVVVAVGVQHFPHVPEPFAALPSGVCTHTSEHADLARFRGQQVLVVGAGNSALETAALLAENGAKVQLIARERELVWNGQPLTPNRSLAARMRNPESGLGSGLSSWFYSNHPGVYRRLPSSTRVYRARTALGPAGACWLRRRFEGTVPTLTGQSVTWAKTQGSQVRLGLAGADGGTREVAGDHLIAGTGYRTDLGRLELLGDSLLSRIATLAGSPAVSREYQSSVPGLYFIGPAVAPTMGPVMRFVFGASHPARVVSRHLAAAGRRPVTAGR